MVTDDSDYYYHSHQNQQQNHLDLSVDQSNGLNGSPQCLIALGRLQITSRPDAIDLCPSQLHEFMTRHSADMVITFCDQRVKNVLGLNTGELLGQPFVYFLASSKDKTGFQEVFDRGKCSD